jgi:aspartate carbamoyltransferase
MSDALFAPFKGRNVVSAAQFNRAEVEALMALAAKYRDLDSRGVVLDVLKGKILVPLFFEQSTRTFTSFCAAMAKLGGTVTYLPLESSSLAKGETLEDTLRTVDCYADVICLRHKEKEALARAENVATRPIINCGNGIGEHPSQSLLDIFTIQSELGRIDGLTIALLGDLKNGRTVHSLSKLLMQFSIKTLVLIAPDALAMPQDVVEYVRAHGRGVELKFAAAPTPEVMADVDVLYVTRIQKERFTNVDDYNSIKGSYVISKASLVGCKDTIRVMHPLPRIDEISTDLDADPRAAYFRQMKCGLYMRMALLSVTVGGKLP